MVDGATEPPVTVTFVGVSLEFPKDNQRGVPKTGSKKIALPVVGRNRVDDMCRQVDCTTPNRPARMGLSMKIISIYEQMGCVKSCELRRRLAHTLRSSIGIRDNESTVKAANRHERNQ